MYSRNRTHRTKSQSSKLRFQNAKKRILILYQSSKNNQRVSNEIIISERPTSIMPVFTLPEMKFFKKQATNNLIKDLKADYARDRQKWEAAQELIAEFDTSIATLENFDKAKAFRGSKSPFRICERMRFAIIAELYLRNRLRYINADLSQADRAQVHHLVVSQHQDLVTMDGARARDLRNKFEKLTHFTKMGDNQYRVCIMF